MRTEDLVWQDEQGNRVNPYARMKLVSAHKAECSFCGTVYYDRKVYEDDDGDQHISVKDCPPCFRHWHADETH